MKRTHRPTHKRRGFTIVELVIVIAVIGILATVLVPTFGDVINSAKDSAAKQEAKNAYTVYIVEAAYTGEIPELFLYKAEEGRVVAIQNGVPVGVYESKEDALRAMLSDADPALLKDSGNGKLFVYGGTTSTLTNPYAGKTVSILGDSISTFAGVSNVFNCVYPNSSVKTQADTWWQQVIDALGMELLVNNASGGSRILSDEYFNGTGIRNGNHAAYRDRCVNLHSGTETPDVILVFLGTNDFSYHIDPNCAKCQAILSCQSCTSRPDKNVNVCAACRSASGINSSFCNQPLGTASEVNLSNAENPTSTCEAYAVMLHKMKQAYPEAQIFCLSLLPRVAPYQNSTYHDHGQPTALNTELKQVAETAGATFIDLEQCVSNASATWGSYFGDSVHPTAAGMDKITNAVVSAMSGKRLYTVSGNLTNVILNGSNIAAAESGYTATLTPASGCIDLAVTVTMGGKDITATAYSDGIITIPSVTGDISITAFANGAVWSVGAIHSGNGSNVDGADWQRRIRTDFMDVSEGATVSVAASGSNAAFCPIFYNADKTYAYSPGAYQTDPLTVFPGQYAYMRLMVCNLTTKDDTSKPLTAAYGENIHVTFGMPAITWTVGAINSNTGADAGMSSRVTTGYIPVSESLTVDVYDGDAEFCVFFYSNTMAYLGYNNSYITSPLRVTTADCAYIRLMARNKTDINQNLTPDFGKNIRIVFE